MSCLISISQVGGLVKIGVLGKIFILGNIGIQGKMGYFYCPVPEGERMEQKSYSAFLQAS